MNKALYLILLVASCLAGFAADPAIPEPDVSFFTKLRMDYSQRKDFSPAWKFEDDRQAVIAAYKAKDYKKAFELSERWLAKCPVDVEFPRFCGLDCDEHHDSHEQQQQNRSALRPGV